MAPAEKEEEEEDWRKFDFDKIHEIRAHNALVYARGMAIVDKMTASWNYTPKTQEELDAEDAKFWPPEKTTTSTSISGNPIDSKFLISEAERNNKALRAKLLPSKGLKASKPRDAEVKAASAKRGLNEESSDEEEGRSGLGKAKKLKVKHDTEAAKNDTPLINKALLPGIPASVECDTDGDHSAAGNDGDHNNVESMDVETTASKTNDGNDQAEVGKAKKKKKKNKKKKNKKKKKKSQAVTEEETEVKTVSGPADSNLLPKPDDNQVHSPVVRPEDNKKMNSAKYEKDVKKDLKSHTPVKTALLNKPATVLVNSKKRKSESEDEEMPDDDEGRADLGESKKHKKKKQKKAASTESHEEPQPKASKDLAFRPPAADDEAEPVPMKPKKVNVQHTFSKAAKKLNQLRDEASKEPAQPPKKELTVEDKLRRKLEKKERRRKEIEKAKKARKA